MAEEKSITRNIWASKEKVKGIVLELEGKNKEKLRRIRFECVGKEENGDFDITFKPKKSQTTASSIAGMNTEHTTNEQYNTSDFVVEFDWLKELAEQCKNEPQELIISYQEIQGEREGLEVWYKYLTKDRFETLYWDKHHKPEVLEEQKSLELRYSKREQL